MTGVGMTGGAGEPARERFAINVVTNRRDELLLLKRSEAAALGPGRWGFPAGHIEAGETPRQCALRELAEEVGGDHDIRIERSLGPIRDQHYGGVYEIHLYHLLWRRGAVTLNHEHSDYAWVSRREYKNYAVMDGIDQDLYLLKIWPPECLNRDKIVTA